MSYVFRIYGIPLQDIFESESRHESLMKAIVQDQYGATDVLRLEEVKPPTLQADQVLVKVWASSVNAGDWHLMRGTPLLIRIVFGGLLKPKIRTLGVDVAGKVVAVGKDVTQFQPGDEVLGDLSECGHGAFAEYARATENALVLKPKMVSFDQAAALPGAAVTALQALRDVGQIQPGQQVLVHGASGGVGSFTVQLAKTFGAEVTGVCSTNKIAMVRAQGADHIVDYTQTDCTQTKTQYDLIIDAAAYRPAADFLPILKPGGTYVMIGGSTVSFFQAMLLGPWLSKRSDRNIKYVTMKPNQTDLTTVRDLMAAGKITPHIDRSFSLSEVPAAIRYVEQRQVQGKVVICIQ